MSAYQSTLVEAERRLNLLHKVGIKGQKRDFKDIIDANRAGLTLFASLREPILRRQWSKI